jgi:hypothetical protein
MKNNKILLIFCGAFISLVVIARLSALRLRAPAACQEVTQEDCMRCCADHVKTLGLEGEQVEEANKICLMQCPGNQEPFNVDLPY